MQQKELIFLGLGQVVKGGGELWVCIIKKSGKRAHLLVARPTPAKARHGDLQLIATALLAYQIFFPDSPKREREHGEGIGLYVRGIKAVYVQAEGQAGVPIKSFDVAQVRRADG